MSQKHAGLLEVLKEKYEYENERKRYYDNVINLPVSLLAFIITGTYFIISEHSEVEWFNRTKPYLIFSLLGCSVISMFFLFRVFFKRKRKYNAFPDSAAVHTSYKAVIDWYNALPETNKKSTNVEDEFQDYIVQWYLDCNNANTAVNDERAEDFHSSKMFIGLCYVLGIVVFVQFCWVKLKPVKKEIDKPIKVQVTNPVKVVGTLLQIKQVLNSDTIKPVVCHGRK